MELNDGRLLSWSYDRTLRLWGRLWGGDGTPLGEIDEQEADRLRYATRRTQGEAVWKTVYDTLIGVSTPTGEPVCHFVSDARLRTAAQLPDGTVATGGAGGALHFLHPNAALRRLMNGEGA